jgi:hypothetical protein
VDESARRVSERSAGHAAALSPGCASSPPPRRGSPAAAAAPAWTPSSAAAPARTRAVTPTGHQQGGIYTVQAYVDPDG